MSLVAGVVVAFSLEPTGSPRIPPSLSSGSSNRAGHLFPIVCLALKSHVIPRVLPNKQGLFDWQLAVAYSAIIMVINITIFFPGRITSKSAVSYMLPGLPLRPLWFLSMFAFREEEQKICSLFFRYSGFAYYKAGLVFTPLF